jgi:hypothetical protein
MQNLFFLKADGKQVDKCEASGFFYAASIRGTPACGGTHAQRQAFNGGRPMTGECHAESGLVLLGSRTIPLPTRGCWAYAVDEAISSAARAGLAGPPDAWSED